MRRLLFLATLLLTACPGPDKPTDDTGEIPGEVDLDGDGYDSGSDCDDSDPAVFPGAVERCNGYDDDCDGFVDDEDPSLDGDLTASIDDDGDGFGTMDDDDQDTFCEVPSGWVEDATDCDDEDPDVYPGAQEYCNEIDDDCDGEIDEDGALDSAWYLDSDGDGFGDDDELLEQCEQPSGYVLDGGDCDDADDSVFPGADEYCNDVDDDCDGEIDEGGALDAATWYADADSDGFGDPDSTTAACEQPSGYVLDATDCDDASDGVFPGADEYCNEIDDDCDGDVDEDDAVDASTWYADLDSDGYGDAASTTAACEQPTGYLSDSSDCDDTNDASYPGADEICDALDNDCDGTVDEDVVDGTTWYLDGDGDGYGDAASSSSTTTCDQPTGYVADDSDCDDSDASIHPYADEYCNGIDDDCDGSTDESSAVDATTWYADADNDSYGDTATSTVDCEQPSGFVADATDCDDLDSMVNPAADEYCDSVDNDCDGITDEADAIDATTWYDDADGDSYGDPDTSVAACTAPSGYVADFSDCDDDDASINPAADEYCDGVDNDCDGATDDSSAVDASTWYADSDGDGYGDSSSTVTACSQPSGHVSDSTDCLDSDASAYPGADEYCDGVDNDCDGAADEADAIDASTWYLDTDRDGYGDATATTTAACSQPAGHVSDGTDCDDTDALVNPGSDELCNGYDDDCDGDVDEDTAVDASTWYTDADGDGYGDSSSTVSACSQPSGTVTNSHDCDDTDAAVYPLADEYCNGYDDDCDGDVDEDTAVDTSTFYMDGDGDGYGRSTLWADACSAPSGFVADNTDCDDSDAGIHPGADEYCDRADHDCDGDTTAGAVDADTWYADTDGDGYGDSGSSTTACTQPSGYSALGGDCDETDTEIHPGATEYCDGVDTDCDGIADGSGLVTFEDTSGSLSDYSTDFATGTASSAYARTLRWDGTLVFCPGTYYTHLTVRASTLAIEGSGGSGSITLQGDGTTTVIAANSTASSLSIEGVTVRNGSASYGGGIHGGTHGLDIELDDVVIEDCYASNSGGGLYQYGSGSVIATDLVLDSNQAASNGAGLYAWGSDVYLDGAEVTDNEAGSYGGGLYIRDGNLEIDASTLSSNEATYAGGLFAYEVDLEMYDSEVTSNEVSDYGGGLYFTYSDALLDEVQVHGNSVSGPSSSYSGAGGGLFLNNGSYVYCAGTTSTTSGVYDNTATWGAGAFLYDSSSELESDVCDWGSDSSDNDPDDVALYVAYWAYTSYGDDESFWCSGYGCY